ncbi:uncharacterized protein LOC135849278 [Planococcus citri]|uniref:uncharacterized protein LOC135849278 n=1 Tax=Planococcus citri TaxID=170843 RepID=UPI0031F96C3F
MCLWCKMDNIFGFFVVLGVSASLVFGANVPSNEDYAGKLFGSLFNNDIPEASSPSASVNGQGRIFGSIFDDEVPHQARNDTPSTSAPTTTTTTTTSKPTTVSKPETEVVYIPVHQEPSYDPNYFPMIPPYPVLYSAPMDSRYQLNDFGSYYPIMNQFPSAYDSGLQNSPLFNQDPIRSPLEKIIYQPISQNAVPTIMKPDSSYVGSDRLILHPIYENSLPNNFYGDIIPSNVLNPNVVSSNNPTKIPSNVKPDTEKKIILKPVFENNPSSLGQLTEYGRDELNRQIMKLIDSYLIKTKQIPSTSIESHTEQNIDETSENSDEYPVIQPSTPSPSNYTTSSITQEQTNKVHRVITTTEFNATHKIPQTEVVFDSDKVLPALTNETFQSSIEVNQSIAGTVENGTDDSSKLDSNANEKVDVEADILSTISPKDLITRLENNRTSVNDSKLNDRFITESATMEPTVRTFTDSKGNKCTEETVAVNGKEYNLYRCEEKSFDGKYDQLARKTVKPDVTYFTEELPSATESAPSNDKNNQESDESAKHKTESSTLNTVVYSTNFDEIE